MPTISNFYGIIIVMYFKDKEHNPPHIHAITNDFVAPFSIRDGTLLHGRFPRKASALVQEFILKYKDELEGMWETGIYYRLPPLE